MIGFFDSGLGGLTILDAVARVLPQYDYIYLADTAHRPYGHRDPADIKQLTITGVDWLYQQGAELVILACNTASSVLRPIQQEWLPQHYPDRRLLGIIVPTVEQITGANWRHDAPITTPLMAAGLTVGVLATPATVATGTYSREITKRNPSLQVIEQACPNLADQIDNHAPAAELDKEIGECVAQLRERAAADPFAVLLGCTHYEHVADRIKQHLAPETRLYHQPSIVAASLAHYLQRHADLTQRLSKKSQISYFATAPAEANVSFMTVEIISLDNTDYPSKTLIV